MSVLNTNGVPLTVFGGAVPELAPEDLPEGASPFCQDVDYNPGSVFTRGGRQNQYVYFNDSITSNPTTGTTNPGAFAPNETAWQQPSNIVLDSPTSPAVVALNGPAPPLNPILGVDATPKPATPATWTVSTTPGVWPTLFAWWLQPGVYNFNVVSAGWTTGPIIGGGYDYGINFPGSLGGESFQVNVTAGNPNYVGLLLMVKTDGITTNATNSRLQQNTGFSGSGPVVTVPAFTTPVSAGTVLILFFAPLSLNNSGTPVAWDLPSSIISDSSGDVFTLIGNSEAFAPGTGGYSGVVMYICQQPTRNVKPSFTVNLKSSGGGTIGAGQLSVWALEMIHFAVNGIYGGIDQHAVASGSGNSATVGPIVPSYPNAMVVLVLAQQGANSNPPTVPANWATWQGWAGINSAGQGTVWIFSATGSVTGSATWGGGAVPWAATMVDFPNSGPVANFPIQEHSNTSPLGTGTISFGGATTAGNNILVGIAVTGITTAPVNVTLSDNQGNVYAVVTSGGGTVGSAFSAIGFAKGIPGGSVTITYTATGAATGFTIDIWELYQAPVPPQTTNVSQVLEGQGYAAAPANASILGIEVLLSGNQTATDPASIVSVSLNAPGSQTMQVQMPVLGGTVTVGNPLSNWGLALTPALVNSPGFGINVVASSILNDIVSLYGVQLRIFYSPSPASNFNWIKTYEQTDGEIDTLALDSFGRLWDEDVDSNPTLLNAIFNNILPNTFAQSVTFDDIEYIAFSNLVNGTDVPRQWNGTNLDRISMVGPGAMCNAAPAGGSGGSNITPIQNITQAPKVEIRRISWGASINAQSDSTPGNVLVVSLPGGSTHGGNPALNMNVGDSILLTNITNPFPLKGGGSLPYNLNNGPGPNNTYTLLSSGTPIIGGGETDTAFTLQAPAVQYGYSNDFSVPPTSNWFYQDTVATITLQAPIPNVGVGSTIQISGTGTAYDGSWTVLSAPNAASMTITSVILVGGIATYTFTLVPGSASPAALQYVSIANVLNSNPAGPPGIFNTTVPVQIQSVTSNTFSINISNPDITPAQNQVGNSPTSTAQVSGTVFTIDPQQIVNSGNPVTGGDIIQQGLVATGQRKVCYSFLTRSGFITQPSPINTFDITSGSGGITISGLSPGPSNVVARIVFFTGANGGNFFYIPQEVDVTIPGQPIQKNTATIVNDNTSTQATFSFTDAVLLAATAVDITGNNLFNCVELGSCRGLLTYSSRMIAWSEQSKVTNFRNLSFDGGYSAVGQPLGWTVVGGQGNLQLSSPVFGWSYVIINSTGITQPTQGMITQPAFQDEFGVPIINANALYSVRITALCTPPEVSGNLIVDLFSATTGGGTALGTFSIPFSGMTQTMQIYTGTLLTTVLHPVPNDLVLRIWAQNMPNGASIQIDRVEPFLTLTPVLSTAFKCSYVNNQESFDLNTGVCGPEQNMQPINGAMELFDLLYALKERSWYSTFDNGTTEPDEWNWKEVSNKVGTIGIHSFDWGEGWALTANREGVFFFEGGEPLKVSQEIQPLWDMINWTYGYTIWLRNDPEQKRFTVGVPIPTPNQYMPEFPVNANPTSPNAILMCNYRELNSGSAMAQTGPIRSTYMGRLMSPEPARKWSFWNISCPYSDYISRANNQWPQFFCTGYADSKIFALLASQLSDDGNAINSFWVSYGFVKPEAADAKGLGLFRMEFPYFTVLAIGSGNLNTYVYPESPFNSPYVLDQLPLPAISQGDLELGVNIKGQRFFVRVGTNAVGSWFRCSKMVVPLIPDPWSPVRGYNVITA